MSHTNNFNYCVLFFIVLFSCSVPKEKEAEIYAYPIDVPVYPNNVNYREQFIVLTNKANPNDWFDEIHSNIENGNISIESIQDSSKHISFVNISDLEKLSKGQRYCNEKAISVWTISSEDSIPTIPKLDSIPRSFFGFYGKHYNARIKIKKPLFTN